MPLQYIWLWTGPPVHTSDSIREILFLCIFNLQTDDVQRSRLKHSTHFLFISHLQTLSEVFLMTGLLLYPLTSLRETMRNTHEAPKQHEMFHYDAFQRQSYITIQTAELQIWRDRCLHNPRPTRHCKNHIGGSQVNTHLANFSSLLYILSVCGSKNQPDVFVHSL